MQTMCRRRGLASANYEKLALRLAHNLTDEQLEMYGKAPIAMTRKSKSKERKSNSQSKKKSQNCKMLVDLEEEKAFAIKEERDDQFS